VWLNNTDDDVPMRVVVVSYREDEYWCGDYRCCVPNHAAVIRDFNGEEFEVDAVWLSNIRRVPGVSP
jgi:hypothetical protein